MTGLQAAILGGSALILLVLALRLGLQRHLPRRLLSGLPLLRQREQFLGRFCPSPI